MSSEVNYKEKSLVPTSHLECTNASSNIPRLRQNGIVHNRQLSDLGNWKMLQSEQKSTNFL